MTFGTNAAPTVPLPNTQLPNGNPLSCRRRDRRRLQPGDAGQHDHSGCSDGEPLQRPHRGDRRKRQLRGRLAEPEPGRQRLGNLRQAVQRQRCQSGQRVPGQHHHGRRSDGTRPWRWVQEAISSSSGQATTRTAAAGASIGQQYSSLGLPVGGEFRVNTYTTGDQSYPDIAMDQNGDFVVTWASSGEDGSGWGVYAQTVHRRPATRWVASSGSTPPPLATRLSPASRRIPSATS